MRLSSRIFWVVVILAAGLAAFFSTAGVAQKSDGPTLLRCNLEGFLIYEIAMWRELDITLEDARKRIAKRNPDYETNTRQRLNMIFMGLAAQQVYSLQTLEPIDLSIAFYNGCRRRMEQYPPDLQL